MFYSVCSVEWEVNNESTQKCLGTLSFKEFDDLLDEEYLLSCVDPFTQGTFKNHWVYCATGYRSTFISDVVDIDNLYTLITPEASNNLVRDNDNVVINITGSEFIALSPVEETTTEDSTPDLFNLTSAEYQELSSHFLILMLLAFGIRMVRSMLIKR